MKFGTVFFLILIVVSNTTVSAEVDVSGELRQGYCSKYFGLMSFDFNNETDMWMQIKAIQISFGDSRIDEKVEIVAGEQLVVWHEAIRYQLEQVGESSSLFLASFPIAGETSSDDSDEKGQLVGADLSLLAINNGARIGNYVPSAHLYSLPINIPPGLVINRWIVLRTQNDSTIPYLEELTIELETDSGVVVKQRVAFRGRSNKCSWQKDKKTPGF